MDGEAEVVREIAMSAIAEMVPTLRGATELAAKLLIAYHGEPIAALAELARVAEGQDRDSAAFDVITLIEVSIKTAATELGVAYE